MPIRKRLTNAPKRENPFRNGKGRHPLLKNGSPHFSVWDVLCEAHPGGLTAAGIKNRTTLYHPQVMKDLLDCKLAMALPKRTPSNELVYVADRKARGIVPTEVSVVVDLLEDEEGYFHAVAYVVGSSQQPKGAVRTVRTRKLNFVVPMEHEVTKYPYRKDRIVVDGVVLDGEYTTVVTDPSLMLIEQ